MSFECTPVEEYLAKWICDQADIQYDAPIWVAIAHRDGEPDKVYRVTRKPMSKTEMEATPPPESGGLTYDRGDKPVAAWHAFITQAREATQGSQS